MPFIAPFKGLRYNPDRVRVLSRVVTPPYDVISPEGQAQYYRKHPWNFVRVVFGQDLPSDDERNNRYSRARETLTRWIREGILQSDPTPSLYPYLQKYRLGRRTFQRRGVITLVRLDSPKIYPHEETRQEPKADRLRLLQAAQASLSSIFGLVPDPEGRFRRLLLQACQSRRPVADLTIDGVIHRLWRIETPSWIRKLKALLESQEIIIADGHHRYEAAKEYCRLRKRADRFFTPRAAYNFAMFYLVSADKEEPGLFPTHRLIRGIPRHRLLPLVSQMKRLHKAEPVRSVRELFDRLKELKSKGRIGIGLTTGNGESFLVHAPVGSSYPLDVEWLHQEILPNWLGPQAKVSYTQDLGFGLRELREGKAQLFFLLKAPSLSMIFQRARTSLRMPGKTTYFYPKPLAGLVEYTFKSHGDIR